MSDLVQTLRDGIEPYEGIAAAEKVMDMAAAEIERLSAENKQLGDHWNDISYERNDLRAEIGRLRAKLAIIHDIAQEGVEHDWQAWDNVRTTAASALNETETEQPQEEK